MLPGYGTYGGGAAAVMGGGASLARPHQPLGFPRSYPRTNEGRNRHTAAGPFVRDAVDDMPYERLLEIFGDGNESRNLAADPHVVASLPSSTLVNPTAELPENERTCAVCLEEYERGDVRKMLPCWHGFHASCIDRWLGENASCPVCKNEVGE